MLQYYTGTQNGVLITEVFSFSEVCNREVALYIQFDFQCLIGRYVLVSVLTCCTIIMIIHLSILYIIYLNTVIIIMIL